MNNKNDLLLAFLTGFEEGRVFIPAGNFTWKFTTKGQPTSVWVTEETQGNLPVCQGGVNLFGVQLQPDGFILIAEVKTEMTEVFWHALLGPSNANLVPGLV